MALRFEWDPDKARRTLRKHAVSFEEAATAFEDERSITLPDHAAPADLGLDDVTPGERIVESSDLGRR